MCVVCVVFPRAPPKEVYELAIDAGKKIFDESS